MIELPRDLTRTTLAVLFTGVLILGAFLIVRPFISTFVWAAMIVVATWPIMLSLQDRLGGRRWLAVTCMTAGLVLLFVLPVLLAVSTVVEHGDTIVEWAKSQHRFRIEGEGIGLEAVEVGDPYLARPLTGRRAWGRTTRRLLALGLVKRGRQRFQPIIAGQAARQRFQPQQQARGDGRRSPVPPRAG